MYEVLMVLSITGFEWTWLSYIIDIISTYSNTYTYVSCTCKKGESLYRHSLLLHPIHPFIYSCKKICLKLCTYLKQLKIVEFGCRSKIVYFRASVLLVLLAYILFQVSALLLFLGFFLYKNLHNFIGHLNIQRSLFISL